MDFCCDALPSEHLGQVFLVFFFPTSIVFGIPHKDCRGCHSALSLLGFQASETHVLEFQVLVDTVLGPLVAQTRLFYSTKGGLDRGRKALIHSDNTDLQRLGHAPDLRRVLGEEVT